MPTLSDFVLGFIVGLVLGFVFLGVAFASPLDNPRCPRQGWCNHAEN